MGKPKTPPAPNYEAAAQQQGQSNIQAALVNALMGQTNQITPFGSQRFAQTGQTTLPGLGGQPPVEVPQFTSTISLSPTQQAQLGQQQEIAGGLLGRTQETLGQPYQAGSIDQMQNVAEEAILSRLEPQLRRTREQRETDLQVRGHAPGGEAWRTAQEGLAFQETDARRQAILDALRVRPQLIQEEVALRGRPLSELAALQSGSPITIPQFGGFGGGGGGVAPAPVFGATQQAANAANQIFGVQSAQASGQTQAAAAAASAIISAMII